MCCYGRWGDDTLLDCGGGGGGGVMGVVAAAGERARVGTLAEFWLLTGDYLPTVTTRNSLQSGRIRVFVIRNIVPFGWLLARFAPI